MAKLLTTRISRRTFAQAATSMLALAALPTQAAESSAETTRSAVHARLTRRDPLLIAEQGSFAAGGAVIEPTAAFDPLHPESRAQSLHGDHAFVSYQMPAKLRGVPLVFLHGAGQFSKTWDTTPDGREGFRNLFLRLGHSVYLVDQPRRGGAGRSIERGEIPATPDDQFWFGQFRMGLWPNFYPGSAFAQDAASLDQFFRQMTPNTAPYNAEVNAQALSAVMARVQAS